MMYAMFIANLIHVSNMMLDHDAIDKYTHLAMNGIRTNAQIGIIAEILKPYDNIRSTSC
jgi:hypothetical protein